MATKSGLIELPADVAAQAILRKARESCATVESFFADNAPAIGDLARLMAERFSAGRRLFVMGNGGSACDAEHFSVEFMHPIFEKRRPLPCISLSVGSALMSAIANDEDFSRVFAVQLARLAKEGDVALAISTSGMSANLVGALQEARRKSILTVAVTGKDGGRLCSVADFSLVVPSYSIHRIQETHVALLHILWDLIHLNLGEDDIV